METKSNSLSGTTEWRLAMTRHGQKSLSRIWSSAAHPIRLFHSLVASAHIRQTNWLVYEPKEPLELAQFLMSFRRVEEVISLRGASTANAYG